MAYYDEQDDLDRWLSQQQAPNLEPTPTAAGAQGGGDYWTRAASMLGGQARNTAPDPAPRQGAGETWATILGMLASRDPASVLAQDAAGRRQAVDAWQRRQAARDDAAFGRQAQAAGLLMREDAAKRAAEAQVFEQDRATAGDIERASETEYKHGRDKVADQHWTATDQREREQFQATQGGLDRRQTAQLAALRGMNTEDNQRALEAARIAAAARSEHEAALAAARKEAESFKREKLAMSEANDFRNSKNNQTLINLAQAARGIEDTWAKNPGGDKAGAGWLDSSNWAHPWGLGLSEDDKAVRVHMNTLREYAQNKFTGAAAPKTQEERIALIAGAQPGATEEQARIAVGIMAKNVREQLRLAGSGREEVARKALADMGGYDEWVYGKAPTPEQLAAEVPQLDPAIAEPPPAAARQPPPAGDTLPTTTSPKQWRNAPPIQTSSTPAEPGDLGGGAVADPEWKKRYERYKLGGVL